MQKKLPLDFSKKIDHLLFDYPEAIIAISLIDPSTHLHFNINADKLFHAASLMKVPVMIEVFKLISEGAFSLTDELRVRNHFHSIVDNSIYSIEDDQDVLTYSHLGKTMSIRDLVYQMITVSSNLATNILLEVVSIESIQRTMKALGVKKSEILRGVEDLKAFSAGLNNKITASDIAILFKELLMGQIVSKKYDDAMIEVLLSQQMNEMIPAGLPPNALVAHKTGDITRIHHDAGIIYPYSGAPYILVILIQGIKEHFKSAQLGARISSLVYKAIRS